MSEVPSKHPFQLIKEGMHHIAVNKEYFPDIPDEDLESALKAVQGLPEGDSDLYTHNYTLTSISGDRPTPLTEDPYEIIKRAFLSSTTRPPGMSKEVFLEVRRIVKRMPVDNPIPAKGDIKDPLFVGGKSGAVGGTTVAAGGVVTSGVGALVSGGGMAAVSTPMMIAAGPAAVVGGLVGAGTAAILGDTELSEDSQRVAVGGSSGSSAGAVIGTALGGPVGAAIGAAAGAFIGSFLWA